MGLRRKVARIAAGKGKKPKGPGLVGRVTKSLTGGVKKVNPRKPVSKAAPRPKGTPAQRSAGEPGVPKRGATGKTPRPNLPVSKPAKKRPTLAPKAKKVKFTPLNSKRGR